MFIGSSKGERVPSLTVRRGDELSNYQRSNVAAIYKHSTPNGVIPLCSVLSQVLASAQ